jgi:hypothetical protein
VSWSKRLRSDPAQALKEDPGVWPMKDMGEREREDRTSIELATNFTGLKSVKSSTSDPLLSLSLCYPFAIPNAQG